MSAAPLVVIGIGQDGPAGLGPEARSHLARAQILAGAKRHLAFFPDFLGDKIVLEGPPAGWVEKLQARDPQCSTVVLATGDPLFYGIGRLLLEAFPKEQLLFLPQVTSVALAFAKLKETWNDACVVSLHGRPLNMLLPALQRREPKIAIFTDASNHPAAIASLLRAQGLGKDYVLWVCENLGSAQERLSRWSPTELQQEKFAPLNLVVLLSVPKASARVQASLPLVGLAESAFHYRGEPRGLITKREVRLAALAYLELHQGDVFWDVGAGSGSVALEAARLSPALTVYAIEKASLEHLQDNLDQFSPGNVHLIAGEAPECFTELPNPDAVFVGGSGGRLLAILEHALDRLKPGGRLVLSCITLETFSQAWTWLSERRLGPQATTIQLAHSRPLGRLQCLEPEHPIFLVRVTQP